MIRFKRIFLVIALAAAVFFGYFFFWVSGRYVAPIMVYHSVGDPRPDRTVAVTLKNFRKHMDYLKKHGYNVISLDELVVSIREKKKTPPRSVVITFDDGFDDNYLNAFPVLKEYSFPATIFVIADEVGDQGYVTWEQLKEMEQHGVTAGSHTLDHTYLPGVSEVMGRRQIIESKKLMEQKLGHAVDYIAYPSGGFSEEIKNIVRDAGYKAACTTNRGLHVLNDDLYAIKRIRFTNKEYDESLWLKLSGYYNILRASKNSH
ncbi:MAG TPA: polysaccharide deacetylase family protein [Candidatus Omnitrophota bacterium]|nr:polysaccharide deacetylase family protein [Candidatus Omnitrophota bacterium]HPD84947.1 polysaccharide deacetylase family protein [Candidatus Omnitrophota bacterium]HRZ03805.1 polysaccharide deacetylase family protein [Candidatus Omnitrophota bacterium]